MTVTVRFAHPSLQRAMQVPVKELWPILMLAEATGCAHIAEEVIGRIQAAVGSPGQREALYAEWSPRDDHKEVRGRAEAFLATYRSQEGPSALLASMKARQARGRASLQRGHPQRVA